MSMSYLPKISQESSNMSLMYLIKQLGEDFDLLTYSDEWLEEERKSVSSTLERIAKELRSIIVAQRAKQLLQDKNMVAVQSLVKSNDGKVTDVLINLMSLPDALEQQEATDHDALSSAMAYAQIAGWTKDGYDLPTSEILKDNKKRKK